MKKKCLRKVMVFCAFGAFIYLSFIINGRRTHFVHNIIKFATNSSDVLEKSYFTKYVLIWTSPRKNPLFAFGKGNDAFQKRMCLYQNCYITSNKQFMNISRFDAILFHGPEMIKKDPKYYLPTERSANQSYFFVSMESSQVYKVPDNRYDGIFNFTWTYKLNSDIKFPYMVIKDHEGKVIGPNQNIRWINIDDMLRINATIKAKLANKRIAAAWFVSNCKSRSKREKIAKMVIRELHKYNLTVDVYGKCGNKKCPRKYMNKCLQMLQRDYYFYFAFENSFSADYVTEKLKYSLQNYVVPIVYGRANYER